MKESQIILQGTTPEALAELIDSKLEVRLNELQKNFTPSDPDILLTRDDVCKLLHIGKTKERLNAMLLATVDITSVAR